MRKKVIVVGHRHLHCIKERITGGGGETFERDLLKHLGGCSDFDVTWVTQDSEDLDIQGVHQFNIPIPNSMGMTKGERAAITRRRNRFLLEYLTEFGADFIFNNDDSNVGVCRIILSLGVPSVTLHHAPWLESGFRNLMGILPMYRDLVQKGHGVCTVSKANRDKYNEDLLKKGAIFAPFLEGLKENPDMYINEYIHPFTAWEKPVAQPSNGRFCLLTRMTDGKNFNFIVDVAGGGEFPIYWFSPTPIQLRDIAIKEKVLKTFPANNIIWDLPYGELMEEVGKAEAILVTGYESFSISAAEANSNGVPVILVTDEAGHPCLESCSAGADLGSVAEVLFKSNEERVEKLESLFRGWKPKSLSEREAILEATWGAYNPEASLSKILSLMSRVEERTLRISGPVKKVAPTQNTLTIFNAE